MFLWLIEQRVSEGVCPAHVPWVGPFAGQAAPSAGWAWVVVSGTQGFVLWCIKHKRIAVRLRAHTHTRYVRASTRLVPPLCARLPAPASCDRESQLRRTANRCFSATSRRLCLLFGRSTKALNFNSKDFHRSLRPEKRKFSRKQDFSGSNARNFLIFCFFGL